MYTSKMFGVHNIAYKLLLIMKWSQQNFEFDLLFLENKPTIQVNTYYGLKT